MANGSGATLRIRLRAGVRRHTSGVSAFLSDSLTNLNGLFSRPEKDLPENVQHNYYVSNVRVRSEHCMGFIKGRWSSLRGLRLCIDTAEGLQIASIWVATCIILHAFAMKYEARGDINEDEFFRDGLSIIEEERAQQAARKAAEEAHMAENEQSRHRRHDVELAEGRALREQLKAALLSHVNNSIA